MFGKKTKKESPIESFIGQETIFQGTINTKGSLRIDGQWEGGNINAQGVIIGETGVVKGNLAAQSVIVGGKVAGNIYASEILEIHSKAEVKGDIKTAHLSIADGAIFEGNCSMLREEKVVSTIGGVTQQSVSTDHQSVPTERQVFLPEK
ncbi:MAG TPA: hypothetical protein DHV62_00020 [Elusimicrobia bacterium]|jgi:cytoskeletal protein CcmA (bactofilin family)|nr:hypothetical protein [Elusimicrobiota bacterium]